MYIQEEGGRAKEVCNDSEGDESTEEQLQCNEQYKCTPHGTLSPLSSILRHGHAPWLCLSTQIHASMVFRIHA